MSDRFPFPAAYIMASGPYGTLYVGSTNDLVRRAYEHREGVAPGFTSKYGCKHLVWFEPHDLMTEAIRRENALKHWLRKWKIALIEAQKPTWRDLYEEIAQ